MSYIWNSAYFSAVPMIYIFMNLCTLGFPEECKNEISAGVNPDLAVMTLENKYFYLVLLIYFIMKKFI